MSGLFNTFNIAKRGIFVQQKAIEVTSHNIANANTEGFSRQRVEIQTTRPFGMPTLNNSAEVGQLGTGAEVSAIQRVRDTFIDYQVRTETSTYGQYEAREKFLQEIESIFNEPSETGISTLIGKFFDSWQQLSKQANSSNARTVVAQQSAALADELNHTYTQLKNLKENSSTLIRSNVFEINNLLNQLDQVNQQIIGVRVAGNMPNDLMDRRDLLLDQLSEKFNINIDKKNFEGFDVRPVDTQDVKDGSILKSENKDDAKRFSYITNMEDLGGGTYKLTYYKLGDMTSEGNKMTITVTGLDAAAAKEISETRVLWASHDGTAIKGDGWEIQNGATVSYAELQLFQPSSGELKGYMSMMTDIDNYMEQLNRVAKALALTVNAVHSGMQDVTSTGNPAKDFVPFFVNSDVADYSNGNLINLDAVLAAEKNITAENISINLEILNDVMKIKTRTHDNEFDYTKNNDLDGESDGERAKAIAALRYALIKVQDFGININERKDLFDPLKGGSTLTNNGMTINDNTNGTTIDNYFKDTIDKLGVQAQEAKRIVKNQQSLLDSFTESRLSISGVSLDEEMANLIQFQHAYQANAKIISTVDQLLDVIINGLVR
ncbi:MAG: flagellar hook-associated protein FlgK [Epulopiscium sp.]|jgi:flagellar hook-associated protein 1 FlgK|nr:flagellar hook-associated protein FlgK [Candidatus Epulonipiscium sp.]